MNRTATCLAGLLLAGATLLPGAFAHTDTGFHPVPFFSTGLDVFDGEDGNGAPCAPPEDENACYYGDNDKGFLPFPPASNGPAGWYYGSASAWLEAQGGPDLVTIPLPDPVGSVGVNPGFLFAIAFALCDAEILSDGSASGAPEDESTVDGSPGGSLPDGTFNDGGIGAACHTPSSFYSHAAFNTDGCAYTNAIALDAVSGEDIWISTSCDWLTPAVEAGLLDHLLTLSTCVPNSVFDGSAPGGTLGCVSQFVACAATGVGCPSTGASFCGADGVSDAGESGQGDAGGAGATDFQFGELDGRANAANGVPYPAGPFTDAGGNACASNLAAATFVWNSAIVDVAGDNNDPDVESLSEATYGWISTTGGGTTTGVSVCAEEYRNGVFTTWPCPPELCGLDAGTVAIVAQGAGAAPIGRLTCHDAAHNPTGTLSTSAGTFVGGAWGNANTGPIFSGTHAHCNIANVNGATYAFVQCGKQ